MRPAELQEVGSVEVEPNASNSECDEVPIDLEIIYIYIYIPLPAVL